MLDKRSTDGLKHTALGVGPEFYGVLKGYATDRQLTMRQVVIDAVAQQVEGAAYWPVVMAETEEPSQCRRIKEMVEGRQRQRRSADEGRTESGPRGRRRIGRPPSRIGRGGGPITWSESG